ncbi:MAG TPA: histidine kinase, partial [Actinomycetes bacterium]|nr:histidine kinase [Actinomycetes bacterium]
IGVQGVLPAQAFDPRSSGCPDCPDNLWHLGDDGDASALDRFGVVAGLVWAALVVTVAAVLVVRVSPARRRAEGLRWVPAGVFLGLTLASYAHSLDRGFMGADVADRRLWVAQGATLAALAVGVLAELARERSAERELARVVVDLSTASGSLRAALADRLRDPDLVLAFPVEPGDAFVDEWARPVDLGRTNGAVVTPLTYGGELLATLVHRPGVLAGGDAVEDLVATIHLGLEHERLRAQALAQVQELRASGVRLVETGDEERRRIERDLHDGAQQRLVGIALGVRLLATRSDNPTAMRQVAEELQAAIDELRALAAGLAPLVLADAGLGAAVRALGESRDVRLTAAPADRFPQVVESTAYLAIDRASAAAASVVDLVLDDDRLCLVITVAGGAPDLDDVVDRCTTLGGTLTVTPVPEGHRVEIVLPASSRPVTP